MKRTIFSLLIITFVILNMTSCLSLLFPPKKYKFTFDPSLPVEQTVKIKFESFRPLVYNGIELYISKDNSAGVYELVMPAGEGTYDFNFTFVQETGNYTNYYTIKDLRFKYNFEAGTDYLIYIHADFKPFQPFKVREAIYSLRIYDQQVKKPADDNYLASIPLFDSEEVKKNMR